MGSRGTMVAPLDQLRDFFLFSFRDGLDGTVRAIPDPSL